MSNPNMYLLVFKKPNESQIQIIRETFNDFDWEQGFAVEEIVADQLVNDNLIIQFVSFKDFIQKDEKSGTLTLYPETTNAVLLGKEQFLGNLYNNDIENVETYFCYLGVASDERDSANEIFFKVEYGKYSSLEQVNKNLEDLLSN